MPDGDRVIPNSNNTYRSAFASAPVCVDRGLFLEFEPTVHRQARGFVKRGYAENLMSVFLDTAYGRMRSLLISRRKEKRLPGDYTAS